MLRLLYDASLLGIARRNRATFGLSRTTESLLYALARRSELALTAYSGLSFGVWAESRRYWLEQAPTGVAGAIPWIRGAMSVTVSEGEDAIVLDEAAIQRDLHQLRAVDLHEGRAQRWRQRLDRGRFEGVSPASLGEFDLIHSTYYPLPAAARRDRRIRAVLTVHDIIPILHPEWCGLLGQGPHRYFHPEFDLPGTLATLTPETWVICPSESARQDLCDHLGAQVDPQRVQVIPWAASARFYPCTDPAQLAAARARYRLPPGRYLLSLCTIEPRKNLDTLLRSFDLLLRQEDPGDLTLVLAGALGWDFGGLFDALRARPHLAGRIVFTGRVAEADLAALYSGALAFVYPSLYEGFGLPPLEAMQCGTPVVSSRSSSLPEVVGDAGLLVDPRDEEALAQALLDLTRSSDLRSELAERSRRRASGFSWARCAEMTEQHYRRALAS